jgi:hypothetical protein
MKLTRAIVACNLNKHYLDFWPVVHDAWNNIIGVKCTLVLIANEIPDEFPYKEDVVLFKPIPGLHTAFQAQCIRLLYPCLLDDSQEEGVIISDIDMIPTSRRYFIDTIENISPEAIFSYKPIDHIGKQIYICYVVARPSTWRDIFTPKTFEDIECLLKLWYTWVEYDGKHAGNGWFADQLIFYDYIFNQYEHPEKLCVNSTNNTNRLCRLLDNWKNIDDELAMKLKEGFYPDFHMPPYEENKKRIMDIYNVLVLK